MPSASGAVAKPVVARRAMVLQGNRAGMSWSIVALMAYTVVQIGRPQEIFAGLYQFRLGLVAGGLTAVAALAEGRLADIGTIFRSREMRCVLVIAGIGLISAPMSVWPGGSMSFLLDSYLRVLVSFVLLQAVVRSPEDLRRMLWAFVVSGLLLGLATYLLSADMITADGIRGQIRHEAGIERVMVTDTYSGNELAVILVCTVPFALMLTRRWGVARWLPQVAYLGLIVLAVLRTGSRTGFVLLGVLGILLLVRSKRTGSSGFMVWLVAGGLMLTVASSAYWARMDAMVNPATHYEATYSGRSDIWTRGLSLVQSHPVLGVGIGGFAVADGIINGQRRENSAHNSFVEIWAELGLGGLIAFCFLLWTPLARMRRMGAADSRGRLGACATATEISLVTFILGSFVLSMQYWAIQYFLVGTALVCDRVATLRTDGAAEVARSGVG